MPYIPHTEHDITAMLTEIGVDSINQIFDEIPDNLRCGELTDIPDTANEMMVTRLMHQHANANQPGTCFIGAGAYEHHIPAAVWEITTRGEFYSAYTPYQAEASQGTLQLLYEYQTMMANLTGMDTSNASLYDGASALGEAVLMAVRHTRGKVKRALLPKTVHPFYRRVVQTIVEGQQIELVELDYDIQNGCVDINSLNVDAPFAALVVPQPNFFGHLEDVHALTNWAQRQGALVIAQVNPMSLAMLASPRNWGEDGADIVCGEGQPLGIPLSGGGPYFGFLCCKKDLVRQMPGRIIGRTVDLDGKDGYTLTLQAREQHIRRSKATSNICTNQGLMVTAATIYMSMLGAEGLARTALQSHENTGVLRGKLTALDGVEAVFNTPFFHETVLRLNQSVKPILQSLAQQGIWGGFDLTPYYPELGNALLVCATEMRTAEEMDMYATRLQHVLSQLALAA